MDLEIMIPSEVSQRKTIIISLIRRILKNDTNEFIYKTETDFRHRKQIYGSKGEGVRKDKLGIWD